MYRPISISFFVLILLQRIISYIVTRKNMVANSVPATYISRHFWAWSVTTIGVVAFVYLMVKNVF